MPTVSPWSEPVTAPGTRQAPYAGAHLPIEDDDLAVPGQQQRQGVVGHLADPDVGDVTTTTPSSVAAGTSMTS